MKKAKTKKILKKIGVAVGILLLLFVCLVLFVRSPWGQDIIVDKLVAYISDKTNTEVAIDKLYVSFSGNAVLEGLYLEDKRGDTLLYSNFLEANVPLSPIIFGNELNIEDLEWKGVVANIQRKKGSEEFNFSFLLEALAQTDTTNTSQSSSPYQIEVGEIDLENFRLSFDDGQMGIESRLKLGKLYIDMNTIDLDSLHFNLDDLELQNATLNYTQIKPFPESDETESPLPYLEIDNLLIENVNAEYNAIPDSFLSNIKVGNLSGNIPKIDLAQNQFHLGKIALADLDIHLKIAQIDSTEAPSNKSFQWPNYNIQVDGLNLTKNDFNFQSPNPKTSNADLLALQNITLQAENIAYRPKGVRMDVNTFSFATDNGFNLLDLNFQANMEDTGAELSDLNLQTENSSLVGNLNLNYKSVGQLFDAPEKVAVDLEFPTIDIGLQDAAYFQSALPENEYLDKIMAKPIEGQLFAEGTLDALQVKDTKLKWGEKTSLSLNGVIRNSTEIDSLAFELKDISAVTNHEDLSKFVDTVGLNVSLPKTLLIEGKLEGNLESVDSDLTISLPEGTALIDGSLAIESPFGFAGTIQADSLHLGRLLDQPQMESISMNIDAMVSGTSLSNLNLALDGTVSELRFREYDFSGLSLNADIKRGQGNLDLSYKDDNLNMKGRADVDLDSLTNKIQFNLNVIGADLQALNVTKEDIRVGLQLNADYSDSPDKFNFEATISDGLTVYTNEQYQLDEVRLSAKQIQNKTTGSVVSDFLNGSFEATGSFDDIQTAITQQLSDYFSEVATKDTLSTAASLNLNMEISRTPILTRVFLRGVERLDPITATADFEAKTDELSAKIVAPALIYKDSFLDSLAFEVNGNSKTFAFSAGFDKLVSEPLQIKRTLVEGAISNQKMIVEFKSYDEEKELIYIASEITEANDTTYIRIDPSRLVLNKKRWEIPSNNQILTATDFLDFDNVILTQGQQQFQIDSRPNVKEKIRFGFENFNLQAFLSLFNPDEDLASGSLNGEFLIKKPFAATGLVADFKISDMAVLQNPLGDLIVNADSEGSNQYGFNLDLTGEKTELTLDGNYQAATSGAELDLNFEASRFPIKTITGFFKDQFEEAEGFLTANIDVNGTIADLKYNGNLGFKNTVFKLAALNTLFKIEDESISLNEDKLYLDNFTLADTEENTLVLVGSVGTENLLNPTFNLKLSAEKFRVLNAETDDNELIYGNATVDADLSIQGDLELPKVDGELRVRQVTDLTYTVPEDQLEIQERDGVVIFVNRENPDAIMTRNEQEAETDLLTGFDIDTKISIDKEAELTVVLDKTTGDNLNIRGAGTLNLNLRPNGEIGLAGRYVVEDGHYEASLFNLVNRRFAIRPGGTVIWSGDPFNAALNVTAIYKVETSAAPLMASVTSGQPAEITNRYRQEMPFMVQLNVNGELLQPELSFDLEIPEEEQGSLGGAVTAQVRQLNKQEEELNKQVFSLLAFNRFFPNSGSDGTAGGAAALARDNVNKVLSGQLNAVSDKIFGNAGFEVDFNLDSFTDYQGSTPQHRTQLNINASKRLFDNRLIVTAGSAVDIDSSSQPGQEATPIIGNVSLEYLLTENGRYRLKGFRKETYENVIEGQVTVTGLALIFQREFNRFADLFNPSNEIKNAEKNEKARKQRNNE